LSPWQSARGERFNSDEEQMGSTPYGNAHPAMTGPTLPQDIKINRAGDGRVRGGGRT